MSAVYVNESDMIARIERLELESRQIRRGIEHVRTEADKRVLNRHLGDLRDEIRHLRGRLRW